MQQPSTIDYLGLVFILVLFISYHFYIAPIVAASIASKYGKDYKSWRFNIWFFNIVAVIYLLFALDNIDRSDQRALAFVSLGYFLVFGIIGIFETFSSF